MFAKLFRRQTSPQSNVEQIEPAELRQRLETDHSLLLVDVRWPDEYQREGHIPHARLLPLVHLARRSNELPPDRPLVLICRSGNRSQTACEQLAEQGFRVANLVGGILGWQQQNLPFQQ